MELSKMNKTQLLAVFAKHTIDVPDGKNPEKGPTNAELVKAIEAHNAVATEGVEEAPKPKAEQAKAPKKFKKEDQLRADVLRKERVIIIDTQRFQSLDEEAPISIPASFSNGVVEDSKLISLSGDPQYVSRGLLSVLRAVDLQEWTQEGLTSSSIRKHHRPRFVINSVEGMTDAEIDAQRKRELARSGQ